MQQTPRAALAAVVFAILFSGGRAPAQVFITNTVRIIASAPGSLSVQSNGPTGQSFIADTNAIGWVSLLLDDSNPSNGLPATLHVNLRTYFEAQKPDPNAGAVSGALISSSYPATLTNGHRVQNISGATRFVFPTNVPLVPGTKYWWELVSDSGDDVRAHFYHFSYPDGDVIAGGTNAGGGGGFSIWDMAYNHGIIAQYPEFKNPQLDPRQFDFVADLEGLTDQQFVVETSTNLVTWTAQLTNTFDVSPKPIIIPGTSPSNAPPRLFYRARYLEPH